MKYRVKTPITIILFFGENSTRKRGCPQKRFNNNIINAHIMASSELNPVQRFQSPIMQLNGKLYLMIGGSLVPWNTSGGSGLVGGIWALRTGAVTFQSEGLRVQPRRMSLAGNSASIVARLYPNPNFTGTDYKEVASGTANQYGVWEPMNPPKTATHGVEFRGTSSGDSPINLQVVGYLDPQDVR